MTPRSPTDTPKLGLDLDGCLDEAPDFFGPLTHLWPGEVCIITFRNDRAKAEGDLAELGIRYDDLVLVDSFDAKAEVIAEKGIRVYFDDQPEMLRNIPEGVQVMLVRNGGNYDFDSKHWLFSKTTGRLV